MIIWRRRRSREKMELFGSLDQHWRCRSSQSYTPERTTTLQSGPEDACLSTNKNRNVKRRTCCKLRSPSLCLSTCDNGLDVVAHSAPDIKLWNDIPGAGRGNSWSPAHLFRVSRAPDFFTMLARALVCRRTLARAYATSASPHALVLLEHRQGVIDSASLSALTAAQKLGGKVTGLIVGDSAQVQSAVRNAQKCARYSACFLGLFSSRRCLRKTERPYISASLSLGSVRDSSSRVCSTIVGADLGKGHPLHACRLCPLPIREISTPSRGRKARRSRCV